MISGHQEYGVNLKWKNGNSPVPNPYPTPTPQPGTKSVSTWNCQTEKHAVRLWMRDASATNSWTDLGMMNSQYVGSSCGSQTSAPAKTTSLTASGHIYQLLTIDPSHSGCSDANPDQVNGSCRTSEYWFQADPNGTTKNVVVGSP
ncbi:hypothetical protein BM536_039015 [Streptomyces phaeoluteigriseus]|uniref:Uncharacterized protein n=1 Tax=Streptomyces phaeoluteigriseus TaxID=114686 RepID=A0A1V6MH43_9ACTN|nr:hypothetical protein [Streptomyces phaeoluteigriseus]OQD51633.1 hypothetical protein BM536_039015 [Streptomyces phaeoluteigriseus]